MLELIVTLTLCIVAMLIVEFIGSKRKPKPVYCTPPGSLVNAHPKFPNPFVESNPTLIYRVLCGNEETYQAQLIRVIDNEVVLQIDAPTLKSMASRPSNSMMYTTSTTTIIDLLYWWGILSKEDRVKVEEPKDHRRLTTV